jgi:hypothetical protein
LFLFYGIKTLGHDWRRIATTFAHRFNNRSRGQLSSKYWSLKQDEKAKWGADYRKLVDTYESVIKDAFVKNELNGGLFKKLVELEQGDFRCHQNGKDNGKLLNRVEF